MAALAAPWLAAAAAAGLGRLGRELAAQAAGGHPANRVGRCRAWIAGASRVSFRSDERERETQEHSPEQKTKTPVGRQAQPEFKVLSNVL